MGNTKAPNTAVATIPVPASLSVMPAFTKTTQVGKMLAAMPLAKMNLMRNQYAKDTTVDEFELYLEVCSQRGLNPLANQMYCIVRGKGTNRKPTFQISIDGLRAIAKMGGQYAGSDLPKYGPMVKSDPDRKITNDVLHPEWVEITTYTFGQNGVRVPHPVILYWDEFAPLEGASWVDNVGYTAYRLPATWVKMPRWMIAKCGEAASLRKGNVECSGLYIHEEMDSVDTGITASSLTITPMTTTTAPDYVDVEPQDTTDVSDVIDGVFEDAAQPLVNIRPDDVWGKIVDACDYYGIDSKVLEAYINTRHPNLMGADSDLPAWELFYDEIMHNTATLNGLFVFWYIQTSGHKVSADIWKSVAKEMGFDVSDHERAANLWRIERKNMIAVLDKYTAPTQAELVGATSGK